MGGSAKAVALCAQKPYEAEVRLSRFLQTASKTEHGDKCRWEYKTPA
jgi:hypothetical protein